MLCHNEMSKIGQIAYDAIDCHWLNECKAVWAHDITTVCLTPPRVILSQKVFKKNQMISSGFGISTAQLKSTLLKVSNTFGYEINFESC